MEGLLLLLLREGEVEKEKAPLPLTGRIFFSQLTDLLTESTICILFIYLFFFVFT